MNKYTEKLGHGEERVFTIEDTIYHGDTAFQHVDIVRATGYGLILFLNGERQSSEADELAYHEMLVHPVMFRHPHPKRVFIAGGGEGAVGREILKHNSVEKITQVDIDGELIALCRQHLPTWSAGSYENPRLELIVGDARAYLQDTQERYDIIFLDLPEWSPDTPARELYTVEFYNMVRQRLAPGGLMGLQVGPVHPVHIAAFITVAQRIRVAFNYVMLYPVTELRWGFGLCAEATPQDNLFNAARLSEPLRYYNVDLHANLGAIPTYIQNGF